MDFAYEEETHRFRMKAHIERGRTALAVRVVRTTIPTFDEIGLPEKIHELIKEPNGLIIVTGPAGTGKSTTLAALLNVLNHMRPLHILTLEDPIEFVFEKGMGLVEQREVGNDTFSFAEGLKRALRQDPNVVMIGEMRDLPTMAAALTLAETGHLVLTTLHTRSAATTISRIIDSFPADQQEQVRLQLSSWLRAVIAQILLPAKNGGRVAAREILINDAAIANQSRLNRTDQIPNVIITSRKEGMIAMDQDVKRLVKEGLISDVVWMWVPRA
jgi:twitching motility protein PilT